jgi:PIN domain nuclease of toxin-antitoxin system
MNGYLLDTHTAIWFFNGNDRLSEKASKIIRDLSNPIYLSIASAWEVAIKIGIRKLDIDGRTADFINDAHRNKVQ